MWQKTPEELRQALTAPFPNGDIEWRVSATNKEKTKGLAVPYVTNRAIQNRLDDTVGIDGWHNEFKPWKDEKAQLCGISIYFHERKQWLTKWDGADDSDIESVKGGLSDSMKRAAVEWGIGRYLYGMTQVWVSIEQRGSLTGNTGGYPAERESMGPAAFPIFTSPGISMRKPLILRKAG